MESGYCTCFPCDDDQMGQKEGRAIRILTPLLGTGGDEKFI